MSQRSLSNWLKAIIITLTVIGVFGVAFVVPIVGRMIRDRYPELTGLALPWMISMWAFALPCFAALFFAMKVAVNIGRDRVFCELNAVCVKRISFLALFDSVYFFISSTVFVALRLNHFGFILASAIVVFLGLAFSAACAVLSHLILRAAKLQDESDLTI